MKRLISFITCLLSLTATAAVGADRPADSPHREKGQAHLQDVIGQLQLTDDQKAQIAPILEKEATELKALRDDSSMRRGQKLRRAKSINDTASNQIRALLTSEQQPKYDELRAEMKENMKERAKERKAGTDAAR